MRHLCVYCGSGPGRNPAYMAAARALGTHMANQGIGLVYGGGSLGLMGEVARSVIAGGGHVVGIIPEFLVSKERMLTEVNELIVTASMHERKMTMFERSDGFVGAARRPRHARGTGRNLDLGAARPACQADHHLRHR